MKRVKKEKQMATEYWKLPAREMLMNHILIYDVVCKEVMNPNSEIR